MKLGKYKHYKGNFYEVIGISRFSEDHQQEFVVYKALYEGEYPYGQLWVRPKDMFNEIIEKDGKKIARFEYITGDLLYDFSQHEKTRT
jgi:hypothetical protein